MSMTLETQPVAQNLPGRAVQLGRHFLNRGTLQDAVKSHHEAANVIAGAHGMTVNRDFRIRGEKFSAFADSAVEIAGNIPVIGTIFRSVQNVIIGPAAVVAMASSEALMRSPALQGTIFNSKLSPMFGFTPEPSVK